MFFKVHVIEWFRRLEMLMKELNYHKVLYGEGWGSIVGRGCVCWFRAHCMFAAGLKNHKIGLKTVVKTISTLPYKRGKSYKKINSLGPQTTKVKSLEKVT